MGHFRQGNSHRLSLIGQGYGTEIIISLCFKKLFSSIKHKNFKRILYLILKIFVTKTICQCLRVYKLSIDIIESRHAVFKKKW